MTRGDIWSFAGSGDYAGKPRPFVIVQDDIFDTASSVVVCGFTTTPVDAPLIRLPIKPNAQNGLLKPCWLMVDKITAVPVSKAGRQIGRLAVSDIVRMNQALTVFLGLASSPRQAARA
jgi:mRNA interferase MazF